MRRPLGTRFTPAVSSLALASMIMLLIPQHVHASENANKKTTFTFSGVALSEASHKSHVSSRMVVLTPETKKEEAQPSSPTATVPVLREVSVKPTVTAPTPVLAQLPTEHAPEAVNTGKTQQVTISSYTSSPEETMGNPFITASGQHVHMGTAAWNGMPFGTQFTIPELSGDLVYTVEDRGSMRVMGTHTVDLWRPTKSEAYAIGRRPATVHFIQ